MLSYNIDLPNLNNLLELIKPSHLLFLFLSILFLSSIMTFVLLFHFNKYKQFGPKLVWAKGTYLLGLSALFILALFFLIMYLN